MRTAATVIALLGLSCGVQCWTIAHAVVPAQDAVRYVVLAQAIERDGLLPTLKEHAEHPLFPSLVWLTHAGLSSFVSDGAANWATSAQLASSAMLVLTVVPLYLFLRQIVDEGPAAAGAALFCLLPAAARLGADGLSDSTQLFCIATALWSLSVVFRSAKARTFAERKSTIAWLLLFGLSVGVGLLARPESMVLLPTLAAAVAWFQLCAACRSSTSPSRAVWRVSWPWLGAGAMCVVTGLSAVMGPYLYATGALSADSLTSRVLGRDQPPSPVANALSPSVSVKKGWRLSDGEPMAFGDKDRSVSTRFSGYTSAAAEYFRELPEAMHYWIGLFAMYGLWRARREPPRLIDRFAQLLFVAHSLAAIHMAAGLGYLSQRHLLPLVLLALGPAGRGVLDCGSLLVAVYRHSAVAADHSPLRWAVAVLAGVACLPQTLAPLHTSRQSHRRAGDWLAQSAEAPGAVLDTRGWTALYSGRPTYRYDAAKTAYRDPALAYVVVDERELLLDSRRGRTLRYLLGGAAEQVARFAAERASADTVLVYRWRPERFTKELRSGQRGG